MLSVFDERRLWARRANELGYYAVTRHPADARVVPPEARDADPTEWLDAVAKGSPQDCAKAIARQHDLGVHSVIMHGASPRELAPVVEAYRANRPALHRAVAPSPGRFA